MDSEIIILGVWTAPGAPETTPKGGPDHINTKLELKGPRDKCGLFRFLAPAPANTEAPGRSSRALSGPPGVWGLSGGQPPTSIVEHEPCVLDPPDTPLPENNPLRLS